MSSKKFNNNPSLAYITAPEQPATEETKKTEPQTIKVIRKESPKTEPQTIKVIREESPKTEPQTIKLVKEEKTEQAPQKKYMRLDITDCQEYISLMAAYTSKTTGKYTSMTQYILKLIEADKQANTALYSKLQAIEQMKDEL
jgi:outer membrane biosynthesis protein TonB|nr:MAG: hypothetical protein [Bacteriophage sp.]UVY39266.1 MAG: hypothetical protein [Bacteriophage sp.]DAO17282.1 MAG TPA: hypothetical protein [Bacteriophage sp.]